MPVTAEDRNIALQLHRYRAFTEAGLTPEFMAACAIEELQAYHEEERWTPAEAGDVDEGTPPLPAGWVTVRRWKDWPTRQRARIDLQKMADMYPSQRGTPEEPIIVQIIGTNGQFTPVVPVVAKTIDTSYIDCDTIDCEGD